MENSLLNGKNKCNYQLISTRRRDRISRWL